MRHSWMGVATLVALSVARPTHAAGPGAGWTNAGMMGNGAQGLYATFGFPGLSLGYLRGVSDSLDVGGRFSFQYGGEGVPSLPAVGLKLAADAKLRLDGGMPSGTLTLRVLPGFGFYFPQGFNVVFLQLPIELSLGLPLMPNLLGDVSVQVPLGLAFWNGFGVSFSSMQVPVLIGGGLEYKIDQVLSVHGQLHLGPYVGITFGANTATNFALDALIGLTYRLP